MIRSALIALGLSASGLGAGAAQAQGLVATAPILETCGGMRLTLETVGDVDADQIARAGDVVSARIGGIYSQIFDYTVVECAQIFVSIPEAMVAGGADVEAIESLLRPVEFAFHSVQDVVATGAVAAVPDGFRLLPSIDKPDQSYVLAATPVLDGTAIKDARAEFDYNGSPAVAFEFSPEGTAIFADFTTDNIGEPFAIVLRGKVMSAPVIQSPITGGAGIITGAFTVEDTVELAAVLRAGVLPFQLSILAAETMDGSDPSAAFCP